MKTHPHSSLLATIVIAAVGVSCAAGNAATPQPARNCPALGWSEGLGNYQKPDAAFPTTDTAPMPTPDCNFHQWLWEAFVWATAMIPDPVSGTSVPRFMTLPTPPDLLSTDENAGQIRMRPLTLAARSQVFHGMPGFTEGAGAIVEADGNMLVSQNGYPVYASVHMNPTYFGTARKNLIATDGYQNQPENSYFNVGDAVFKATWARLDEGQPPPAGAFTTKARVPVLAPIITPGLVTYAPVPGQFVTVTVALVGLHVVGYTVNHPEFLWGTFEQVRNSPATADNTFTPSATRSDPQSYTLYKGGTPFSRVNRALNPPILNLSPTTQKLSPVTNAVLENVTGGENQTNGVGNILTINSQARGFLAKEKQPQSLFGSYKLIGTVWMLPNSYNLSSDQTSAVGSVNLANVTAETFVQNAKNAPIAQVVNCFLCHNASSYSFQNPPPPKLKNRLIANSHVLSIGTSYDVPNSISGKLLRMPTIRSRMQR